MAGHPMLQLCCVGGTQVRKSQLEASVRGAAAMLFPLVLALAQKAKGRKEQEKQTRGIHYTL